MKVWIGWDRRERVAADVCRASIKRLTPEASCRFLVEADLRACGLYQRARLPGAERYDVASESPYSTDFAFTRFLVPFLERHRGWALFCDADFLFTRPLGELFALADERYAVMVAPKDYALREAEKMDGQAQLPYLRKWWSALVLWNCQHAGHQRLDVRTVNDAPGRWLHQFAWLQDREIGFLPQTWHWLEGYDEPPPAGEPPPAAIHYTRGGPWFDEWRGVAYADLWLAERALMA